MCGQGVVFIRVYDSGVESWVLGSTRLRKVEALFVEVAA